jgi:hypothetical protein
MEFTIKQIGSVTFMEDKTSVTLEGWAFVDVGGRTIIQCYGKRKLEIITKFLSDA